MTSRHLPAALLAPALALTAALAQSQDAGPVPGRAAAPPQASAPAASGVPPTQEAAEVSKTPEAKVEHLVTEDSQVRIEETRVRGIITRIVVHPKIRGMGSYAIQPANPAVDRENDPAAGKRLWSWGF
jgi:hypothetical protein